MYSPRYKFLIISTLGACLLSVQALADLNGDGHLDAVFANGFWERTCFGDGLGAWTHCSDVTNSTSTGYDVAIGDINGDGHLDLAMAQPHYQSCLGDGLGGFTCHQIVSQYYDRRDVELADLDLDGDLDVIFASYSSSSSACLNDGTGTFPYPSCSPLDNWQAYALGVAVGDVDNDGFPDILFAAERRSSLCMGDGTGAFPSCTDINQLGNYKLAVALGDLDGDGNLDAVFTNVSGPNEICLGDGAGGFSCVSAGGGNNTYNVALGDVNGDRNLDALFANYTESNQVCLGDGVGGFASCTAMAGNLFGTRDVGLGYVDGDRNLDAIFASHSAANTICLGDGIGGFTCTDNYLVKPGRSYGVGLPPLPKTPQDMINDVVDLIIDLDLAQGLSSSLEAKANSALAALEDVNGNNDVSACNTLDALMSSVAAQSGKKIDEADALKIIDAILAIQAALGCGG